MYDFGVKAKNPFKLKNSKRANTTLFQVFTCVTIFGLVSFGFHFLSGGAKTGG